MNTITIRHCSIAFAALLCLGSAQAANFSKAVYNGAKEDIKTTYKAEKEACGSLAGNAKDICLEEAKGREKIELARLEANYTGTPKAEVKLYEAHYTAVYDIAIQRCDDLGGNAKDVCKREAKSTRDKAKADVKLSKKVNDAINDDITTKMKADYKVAREKCDAVSGDTKTMCVASAKARYNERW